MPPFALPARVIARALSARYVDCLRTDASVAIDLARARLQHDGYVAAIRSLGVPVDVLATDDACPDSCFIEDTAVVTGPNALATRPGAPSRRPEVEPVARALARDCTVGAMEAPASLDGGDVLRAGDRLFVGLSTRTNSAGVEVLARAAARDGLEVVPVPVRGGLHLKSACTLASPSLLLFDSSLMGADERAPFRVAGLEHIAAPEPAGANVLALGDAVLVSAAAPETARLLRARGLAVHVLDVSEMHKGDGALTCLSLRIPRAGSWST